MQNSSQDYQDGLTIEEAHISKEKQAETSNDPAPNLSVAAYESVEDVSREEDVESSFDPNSLEVFNLSVAAYESVEETKPVEERPRAPVFSPYKNKWPSEPGRYEKSDSDESYVDESLLFKNWFDYEQKRENLELVSELQKYLNDGHITYDSPTMVIIHDKLEEILRACQKRKERAVRIGTMSNWVGNRLKPLAKK